ncbi:MAG TPA: hypothetical protein VE994_02240 [Terriglobales bacterium]|nr:hypothetical protein [Terriglobales bacterium]
MQPTKFTAFLACAIVAVSVVLAVGALGAQETTIAQVPVGPPVIRTPEPDREQIKIRQEQLKKINSARQAAIKKDTDKLLQLATELKQSVDKSNEHTLSLDVVKKAEEIEKLARSVKDKMKSGY